MARTAQQLVDLITDATAAYHELQLGRAPRVVVDANGERVEFTQSNRQELYRYITQLQSELDALTITPAPSRGPARFLF